MDLLDESDQRLVAALVDGAGTRLKMAREDPETFDPEANFDRADQMLFIAKMIFLTGEVDREAAMALLNPATRGTWFGF